MSVSAIRRRRAFGGTFEVNAESSSYTINGQPASVVSGRVINAQVGSYTHTGSATTFIHAAIINAESGTYIITGLSTSGGGEINAQVGTYSITGSNATLATLRGIDLQVGSYIITGVSSEFGSLFNINAAVGTYNIVGADATFVTIVTPQISALAGNYVLSGNDAELVGPRLWNDQGDLSSTWLPDGDLSNTWVTQNVPDEAYGYSGEMGRAQMGKAILGQGTSKRWRDQN